MSSTKDMQILKGLLASLMLITAAQFWASSGNSAMPSANTHTDHASRMSEEGEDHCRKRS